MLGVTKRHLSRMTKDNLIRAQRQGSANFYDPSEVFLLKEIRASNTTLVEVATRAARAEMVAYRIERKQEQLLSILGVDLPDVDLSKDAVVALHLRAQDELESTRKLKCDDIMFWARTFQSLNEEYFHEVARQFLTDRPWARYYNLSNKLRKEKPVKKLQRDLALHNAYTCLAISTNSMRQGMWFYVCSTAGKRLADKRFPEARADVHEDIMHLVINLKRD